jgi:hypothetical protein
VTTNEGGNATELRPIVLAPRTSQPVVRKRPALAPTRVLQPGRGASGASHPKVSEIARRALCSGSQRVSLSSSRCLLGCGAIASSGRRRASTRSPPPGRTSPLLAAHSETAAAGAGLIGRVSAHLCDRARLGSQPSQRRWRAADRPNASLLGARRSVFYRGDSSRLVTP